MEKKKVKILYIDDEVISLRLFKSSFKRIFEIITAQSAKDGLKLLENQEFDVIITDQRMPGMTGVELLEVINQEYPYIPPRRMIISGYLHDDEIKKAFEEYRLFSFISKPWDQEELETIILNAVKDEK